MSETTDEPRAGEDDRQRGETRSGVRLSRLKGGEHTWNLWMTVGDDAADLRATLAELQAIDAELEHDYGRAAPAEARPEASS
jgi:hypothetical protein